MIGTRIGWVSARAPKVAHDDAARAVITKRVRIGQHFSKPRATENPEHRPDSLRRPVRTRALDQLTSTGSVLGITRIKIASAT